MKKLFDRTLLLYVGLGILNYLVCNTIMLIVNIALHIPEAESLLIEFLLQTFHSFFLNRYVTFRGCQVSKLWPLYSALTVAVCYVLAKLLLRDLFLHWLEAEAISSSIDALRMRLGVTMELELFSRKLVMLLCTLTYSVINYFGQRYLVFRPHRRETT